jgi:biotin-dependent carboxylase-like uncharacterized protein
MKRLRIIQAGLSTTVQDLGRPGHAAIGVSLSGAADRVALQLGNRLLGNPDDAAGLEATLIGPVVEAPDAPVRALLAGARVDAQLLGNHGDRPVPMWRPFTLAPGTRLIVGPIVSGCRAYLIVSGGIATPPVLGSRSVHAATTLGGLPLRDGEDVPVGTATSQLAHASGNTAAIDRGAMLDLLRLSRRRCLRVVLAHCEDGAMTDAQQRLLRNAWTIDHDSDRVGLRMSCAAPSPSIAPAARSVAVTPGTIQQTPDGRLIALGPDAAPTGGYPVLATLIAADLDTLGQLRPSDVVTFEPVTVETAWRAFRERERLLDRVAPAARCAAPHRDASRKARP